MRRQKTIRNAPSALPWSPWLTDILLFPGYDGWDAIALYERPIRIGAGLTLAGTVRMAFYIPYRALRRCLEQRPVVPQQNKANPSTGGAK